MVQLLVRMVAAPGGAERMIHALRAVTMRPVQQARGCRFAQVYHSPGDHRQIEYVEEWDDVGELQRQLGSERFLRLLGLLETAVEPPLVEFRVVSETHGLEYIRAEHGVPHATR